MTFSPAIYETIDANIYDATDIAYEALAAYCAAFKVDIDDAQAVRDAYYAMRDRQTYHVAATLAEAEAEAMGQRRNPDWTVQGSFRSPSSPLFVHVIVG